MERDLGGTFSFPNAPDRVETLCTKPPLRPNSNHLNCRKGGTLDDRDPIRDPRDREPRQARLAREGHSQPPVEGKVAEEAREWARRLGIGSGELAEIPPRARASLTSIRRRYRILGPRRHTVPATRGPGRRLRRRATPQRNVRSRGQACEALRDSRHRPLLRPDEVAGLITASGASSRG